MEEVAKGVESGKHSCMAINKQGHVLTVGPRGNVIAKDGVSIQRMPSISLEVLEFQEEGMRQYDVFRDEHLRTPH